VVRRLVLPVEISGVMRRNRPERAPDPDPTLMTLVETSGAAARAASGFHEAVAAVLESVAVSAGFQAGHALVPADANGKWVSARLWFPDDGIGLGALRRACVEAPAAAVRGHRALALHLEATHWAGDLEALAGTAVYQAASAVGIVAAIACPVFSEGRVVALLEWFSSSAAPPAHDLAHSLGHLSGVLTEVYERPARPERAEPVPAQRSYRPLTVVLRGLGGTPRRADPTSIPGIGPSSLRMVVRA
jgi:hypothetical protein